MKHMLLAAVMSSIALSAHGQSNAGNGTTGEIPCSEGGVSALRIERDAASTRFRGSVKIKIGTTVISADEADILTGASEFKEFTLRGNVRVTVGATNATP